MRQEDYCKTGWDDCREARWHDYWRQGGRGGRSTRRGITSETKQVGRLRDETRRDYRTKQAGLRLPDVTGRTTTTTIRRPRDETGRTTIPSQDKQADCTKTTIRRPGSGGGSLARPPPLHGQTRNPTVLSSRGIGRWLRRGPKVSGARQGRCFGPCGNRCGNKFDDDDDGSGGGVVVVLMMMAVVAVVVVG